MKTRRTHAFSLIALLALQLSLVGCGMFAKKLPPLERDDAWRADIEFLSDNLKQKHKDPFRHCDEAAFDAKRAAIVAAVPTNSDEEILVAMAEWIAMLRDAHTNLYYTHLDAFEACNLDVWTFADGYFIIGAPEADKDLIGARIDGVGDLPIADVEARISSIVSHENKIRVRNKVPEYLVRPDVLRALDIEVPADGVPFRLTLLNGESVTRTVAATTKKERGERLAYWDQHELETPISRTRVGEWYWYEMLPESETAYVAYNKCRDDKNKPFRKMAADILDKVDDGEIDRVIIDLRNNGGGSQIVAWPLLKGLAKRDRINQPGGIYALIGPRTFSSAMGNTVELKKWTEAIFVGAPTGQKPNHFGELKKLTLPYCKLPVYYSTNFWRLLKDEDPDSFYPDILAPTTFVDWRAGRDAALEQARAGALPDKTAAK